ncbi:response regulator [Sporosarcina sp. G11-34]|uniref:response regulator n=1 Tax=Sporosarcina sp. G11-34 TaxID=2849605 RepID=UPI0022A9A0F8|nr:response regulator [Sporosarcina sp. G11-34]MCZ2258383.1 response regulator [Sporosarcina sp. G11-34]
MIDVLIIEDDPMVAKFNSIYLKSIPGFNVSGLASNVEEGKMFLKRNRVDLILLDVYMGATTGLEFLVELRNERNPVDVIIITAANDKASVQIALRYGAVDYLIKPFSFERFQDALLQFQRHFQLLKSTLTVSQDEIDSFLLMPERTDKDMFDLPKGMTIVTFSRIVKQIINREKNKFSAAELAEETGISRVSVRKYLNHLVEINLLVVDVVYQETGRPLHRYKINIEKMDILHSFITK